MKNVIHQLNKAFENRVRLGIMSALMVNNYLDFNGLKDLLQLTDGNLASHLKALEKAGYIQMKKSFIERKPNTKYHIMTEGKEAFKVHINALEHIINNNK